MRLVWLVLWILPALKTRAQYKSDNHLTGGSARPCTLSIKEAVMPNWGFWGNLGSFLPPSRGKLQGAPHSDRPSPTLPRGTPCRAGAAQQQTPPPPARGKHSTGVTRTPPVEPNAPTTPGPPNRVRSLQSLRHSPGAPPEKRERIIVVVRSPCQENDPADAHPSALNSVLESANPRMDSEGASGCTWSTARATARLQDSRPPE